LADIALADILMSLADRRDRNGDLAKPSTV
jgi:hypothetical protein